MMRDYEDAIEIVEKLVSRLLSVSDIASPPVDPMVIAKACRIVCTEAEIKGRRGQNLMIKGFRLIDIQKDDRWERKCFTVAHELLEMELPGDVQSKRERHEIAMVGAPLLLMPTEWFRAACDETDFEIFELKNIFSTASHEAVALRTLVFSPAVVTVVDDMKVTNRRSSVEWFSERKLIPIEEEVLDEIYSSGKRVRRDFDRGTVTGHPLFEEEIKRVILRTELLPDFD